MYKYTSVFLTKFSVAKIIALDILIKRSLCGYFDDSYVIHTNNDLLPYFVACISKARAQCKNRKDLHLVYCCVR